MWRHWFRSCWIANMWRNLPNRDVYGALPPPPDEYGWKKDSTRQYKVDWESPEIQLTVEQMINFLMKGCSCKECCKTKQCSCRKNGHQCGPGCQYQGCTKLNLVNSNSSAPSIPVHPEKEQSSGDETECDCSEDSDTCNTDSETRILYRNHHNGHLLHAHEDSNTD